MAFDPGTIRFLEMLNQDIALQDEVETALQGAADKTGAVIALAKSKGYTVERASFEQARAVLNAVQGSGALDDRQLDKVTGGFNPQPEPPGGVSAYANLVRVRKTLLSW